MNRCRARSAMTLLEVVVALTVAGAALAAGASALGFLTDQQSRTGAQSMAAAHAVRTTLRDWASDARLTTEGDAAFRGVSSSRLMSRGSDDELTFITGAPTPIGITGTIVHLRMARVSSDSVRGLIAELRPWRQAGVPSILSVANNAAGLQVRYLGSIHGKRDWLTTWVSTSVLPAAVELRIIFDSTRSSAPTDRASESLLGIPMTIPLAARQ